MGTLFVDKLDPQSGTSLEIGSSGDTVSVNTGATTNLAGNVTLGANGKTITVPSGCTITNNGTQTGFGGTNDVMFSTYMSSNVTLAHEVVTKLQFNTEIYDVGSCFDTSNYRFTVPSGKGGKYLIGYAMNYESSANTTLLIGWTKPYKNGSAISYGENGTDFYQNNTNNPTRNVQTARSFIVDLSAGDYIELYGQIGHSSGFNVPANKYYSNFWGYKLITW